MESVLSSGSDFLLPGLSYDLAGDQASYVISRRQTQITCNVPTAGPNDVRQVTFKVADPSGFSVDRGKVRCKQCTNAFECSAPLLLEQDDHFDFERRRGGCPVPLSDRGDAQSLSALRKTQSCCSHGIWPGQFFREWCRSYAENHCSRRG